MYSKVFAQIFDSSISEDYVVRHVFMDLLVLANKHGEIDMTLTAISRRTNVPLEIVTHAVGRLVAPDPDSRTDAEEGRRLVLMDAGRSWGWRIVNFAHYNAMRNEDARREYFRDYKREYRANKKNDIQENVQDNSGQSTIVHHESTKSTHTDTDTSTPSTTGKNVSKATPSHPAGAGVGVKHPDLFIYEAYPRKEGRGAAMKAIQGAVARLVKGEAAVPPMTAMYARRWLWKVVSTYAKSPAGQNPDRTKLPHPSTWFNQSRYLDDQANWHQTNWHHTGEPRHAQLSKSEATIHAGKGYLEREAERLGLRNDALGGVEPKDVHYGRTIEAGD